MRTITAEDLQKPCSTWLARLGREGLVVVYRGVPVARLVPIRTRAPRRRHPLIGALRGQLHIRGDIVGPTWGLGATD